MKSLPIFAWNIKTSRASILRIGLIAAFLIVLGNAIVLVYIPIDHFTFDIFISNTVNSLLIGGTMAIGITRIIIWLDQKHPWLKNPFRRLFLQLTSTLGFSILVIGVVIVILVITDREQVPSGMIYESSMFMIKGGFSFLILSMLVVHAIQFFRNWKKSVITQEQLKRDQLDLQYETLKSQVNPHFLFNSLNAITSLIKKDPDKATLFVQKLSEVFRYVLDQKDKEITTVEAELNFLESYLFLQKIRFGENLVLNTEVNCPDKFVVPLSFQMLVENAIKHNVISKEFPLTIFIRSEEDGYISFSNNLKRKNSVTAGGTGLVNIKSRFRFFTSKPVIVKEDESSFTVKIPVIDSK